MITVSLLDVDGLNPFHWIAMNGSSKLFNSGIEAVSPSPIGSSREARFRWLLNYRMIIITNIRGFTWTSCCNQLCFLYHAQIQLGSIFWSLLCVQIVRDHFQDKWRRGPQLSQTGAPHWMITNYKSQSWQCHDFIMTVRESAFCASVKLGLGSSVMKATHITRTCPPNPRTKINLKLSAPEGKHQQEKTKVPTPIFLPVPGWLLPLPFSFFGC